MKPNKKIEIEVIENKSIDVPVEDGVRFIQCLRKEAVRQEALKVAKQLDLAGRNIIYLPNIPSPAAESDALEEFEVYEED